VVAGLTRTVFGQAMKKGDIYTVAGDGTNGFTGDGGPGPSAWVSNPAEVTADAAGNLLIADAGNIRIRVVAAHTGTYYGQAMTAGDIYTVAGDGTRGFAGDGGLATSAELSSAKGIAVDSAGNLVIADTFNERIRVMAAKTGTYYGQAMTARHIYTIAGDGTLGYSADGVPATTSALCESAGVGTDAAGNVLISDYCNNRIRVVAAHTGTYYGQAMTAGDIYTIAGDGTNGSSGDGGPATGAALNLPEGVTVDGAGNVVIADTYNGRIRVVAAQTRTFYGQAMTAGDIYTIAGGAASGLGDGGLATKAELNAPQTVTVDGTGLLIADTLDNRIRLVTG
jgi:secreted PhoX family phosphatase